MAAETMQMNTRINRILKEDGDAALERAGYSPSQAVRKLWSFAAHNLHNPRAIQDLLESVDEGMHTQDDAERTRKFNQLQNDMTFCASAYESLGIQPSKFTSEAPYAELRERALLERFAEPSAQ